MFIDRSVPLVLCTGTRTGPRHRPGWQRVRLRRVVGHAATPPGRVLAYGRGRPWRAAAP